MLPERAWRTSRSPAARPASSAREPTPDPWIRKKFKEWPKEQLLSSSSYPPPPSLKPLDARKADARLHLVHNELDVVLEANVAQLAEKFLAGMVVTTLSLDGLHNHHSNGARLDSKTKKTKKKKYTSSK